MNNIERHDPKIPFYPYLTLPIPEEKFTFGQGFFYNRQETHVTGYYMHGGVDFYARYGEQVNSPGNGFGVASYARFTITNPDGSIRVYQGKPLAGGLGYFVQIYHPEDICKVPGGRITQCAHLSYITPLLPLVSRGAITVDFANKVEEYYLKHPIKAKHINVPALIEEQKRLMEKFPWTTQWYGYKNGPEWDQKESYMLTFDEVEALYGANNPIVLWIEQGQPIGAVGNSAMFWGEAPEAEPNFGVNDAILPEKHSLLPPQLHFEEAWRDPITNLKESRRDPFFLYKTVRWYKRRNIRRSLFREYP